MDGSYGRLYLEILKIHRDEFLAMSGWWTVEGCRRAWAEDVSREPKVHAQNPLP